MNWRYLFRRAKWDRERFEEIESYVRIETDENIARGMPETQARAAARRKLGNSTLIREEIYRMNTVAFLDAGPRHPLRPARARQEPDVHGSRAAHARHRNRRQYGGLQRAELRGAEPLHYPKPDELVALRQMAPGAAGLASFSEGLPLSASMYFTYAEHNRTFQSLGVWIPGAASVTGLAEPEQVRVVPSAMASSRPSPWRPRSAVGFRPPTRFPALACRAVSPAAPLR
jgi:putative ABC transport system permease protein